jgi:uncharacterized protein YjbI with pentapeptide repeats
MPIRSRTLSEEERRALLKLDEGRLTEQEALALLAAASRAETGSTMQDVRFPLTKFRWKHTRFIKTSFIACDLGSPLITRRFFGERLFDRCKFSNVGMDGLNVTATGFRACTFNKVTFGQELFGVFGKCQFEDCSFENCLFSHVTIEHCGFSQCRFTQVASEHTSFRHCQFTKSTIGGRFGPVLLDSCMLEDVDLSPCYLGESTFLDSTFQRVTFPHTLENYFVTAATLESLIQSLDDRLTDDCRADLIDEAGISCVHAISEDFLEDYNERERELIHGYCFPRRLRNEYCSVGEA